ncbi:Uncharacterized protein HZ326_14962 [Fusarium oxysporum f. sp. albedinis]|nr:Uncharacterized protein HZ326_14962 [Fusarium oxysporum f. sp. albedinis]
MSDLMFRAGLCGYFLAHGSRPLKPSRISHTPIVLNLRGKLTFYGCSLSSTENWISLASERQPRWISDPRPDIICPVMLAMCFAAGCSSSCYSLAHCK